MKADGRELFIPLGEILYFRSENVYLTLYMTGGRHCLLRKKLKEQAEGLPPLDFSRSTGATWWDYGMCPPLTGGR